MFFVEWYDGDRRFRSPSFDNLDDCKDYQHDVLGGKGRIYCDE